MTNHNKVLDGKTLAKTIIAHTHQEYAQSFCEARPHLVIIQVGNMDASNIYINKKIQACAQLGFSARHLPLPESISATSLKAMIAELNHDQQVHGILLQLPLPPHLCSSDILTHIDPSKDVDAITPFHLGKLMQHRPVITPCTTAAVQTLLQATGVQLTGLRTTVVGSSSLVGLPTAIALSPQTTVSVCHRVTNDLARYVSQADILVVAIGNPNVIKADWIQPNTIVIDVGINRSPEGRIIGDVPFDQIIEKVRYLTPVPGGVGPLTVAHMVNNLWTLFKNHTSMP